MKIAATLTTLVTLASTSIVNAAGDCGDTIYDIVKDDDNFDTLKTAIDLAGLDDALDGDGPFTVFAPTDDAFDDLPDGVLDALVGNTHALKDILLYHAVGAKAESGDLSDGQRIKTLVGRKVKVDIDGHDIFINNAEVIKADIEACNGVIHVIDKVLIPKIKKSNCEKDDDCGFCEGTCTIGIVLFLLFDRYDLTFFLLLLLLT